MGQAKKKEKFSDPFASLISGDDGVQASDQAPPPQQQQQQQQQSQRQNSLMGLGAFGGNQGMGQQMGHRMSGSSMGGQMGGNPYMSPAQPQQPAMQANPYMSGGAVGVNMQRQQSGPSAVNVNP